MEPEQEPATPAAPNFGRVRIFMTDGHYHDADLPMSWEAYCLQFVTTGAAMHSNMLINRNLVVKIVKFDGEQTTLHSAGNVTQLTPSYKPPVT